MYIWGGISFDIWSEIQFYGNVRVEPLKVISDRISNYIPSQMKILIMVLPILMQFWSYGFKLEHWKPQKAAHHLMICDVLNDVKLFPTVYHRIYCLKFLTLANQASHYKIKCIRIIVCCCSHCVWGVVFGPCFVTWFLVSCSSFAIILLRKRDGCFFLIMLWLSVFCFSSWQCRVIVLQSVM